MNCWQVHCITYIILINTTIVHLYVCIQMHHGRSDMLRKHKPLMRNTRAHLLAGVSDDDDSTPATPPTQFHMQHSQSHSP